MRIVSEFKKFALRGKVIDLAVGFTVGAAFTTVVKSIVDDILMPPLGLVLGESDFSDLFVVLKESETVSAPYATLQAAQDAGAVTLNYGVFINNTVAFLVVALAIFMVVRALNRVEEEMDEHFGEEEKKPEEPETKKCPFCRTVIAYRARRCPNCTSELGEAAKTAG